jgi:ribosome-associated toxin RatA of RatAB toxin-antitoxin module
MADSTESNVVVDATPEVVLGVIADFESYPEWTGAVKEAEVTQTDEAGWASRVRFSLDAGAIRDSYVLAYDWDFAQDSTGVVSWTLVEAGMLKSMDGAYQLDALDGGQRTQVTYRLSVDVRIPMLGMLRRKAEKVIIDTALNELKKRAEG